MASLKDVARLAQVSVGTVSRYLNRPELVRPATRAAVRSAVETLHYSPNTIARSLRSGRTNLIMVVMWMLGDPFDADVSRGIVEAAARRNYSVFYSEAHMPRAAAPDLHAILLSRQADGVIILGGQWPFRLSDEYRGTPNLPPIVIAGEGVVSSLRGFPAVRIDSFRAVADMTRYIVGLGHKRIALIGGEGRSPSTEERVEAFAHAMAEAGLTSPADYVVCGDLTIEGARRVTHELLSLATPPTAIICSTDEMAIGAMAEARAMGLVVPRDLSVVGFDDIRYADVANPPLTTISQPARIIGEQSFNLLWRLLNDPAADVRSPVVPHRLVIRDSAGPPRA